MVLLGIVDFSVPQIITIHNKLQFILISYFEKLFQHLSLIRLWILLSNKSGGV